MPEQTNSKRIGMLMYGVLSLSFLLRIVSYLTAGLRYVTAIIISGASPFILWASRFLSTIFVLSGLIAFFVGAPKEFPAMPWVFLGVGCVFGSMPILLDGLVTLLLPTSRYASRRG